jgi:hypothetical protein
MNPFALGGFAKKDGKLATACDETDTFIFSWVGH